jgi:hypothetical protein
MTDQQILDAIQEHKLGCYWNAVASEPRWDVSPGGGEWKPAFHRDIREAVCLWVEKYARQCPTCGK